MFTKLSLKLRTWLSSNWFFWIIIGFFVLQAAWVAFSAAYPQAFDEDFHFGIITVYAHYWSPFLSSQPPNADAFGALQHDPSFLFYYLLSLPYRFMTAIGIHSLAAQVIVLRLINTAFFAAGLVLFRRVLLRASLSRLTANACIAIVSFIPVSVQVAGQINYDNLLVLVSAIVCLLSFSLIDQLKKRRFQIGTILLLASAGMLGSIVKYEFAPIFFAVGLYFLVVGIRALRGHWKAAWHAARQQWSQLRRVAQISIVLLFVVSCLLFIQRIGVNIVVYHDIAPDCSRSLSVTRCHSYYVWDHDYATHQAVLNDPSLNDMNPINYGFEWVYWLWYRLFFAINGPSQTYRNYPPLPFPAAAFVLLLASSVVAFAVYARRVFKTYPYAAFLTTLVVFYLLILLSQGYQKYQQTGVLQLMNGRYLLPVLLPAAALGVMALGMALRRISKYKPLIVTLAVLCFVYGGGVFTFILRSDSTWYWNNHYVVTTNQTARTVLSPVIFEGSKTFTNSRWFLR